MQALMDGSFYFFRGYFAIPYTGETKNGTQLSGVLGFCNSLIKALNDQQVDQVICAFDESLQSGFRHQIDPNYKSNRPLADQDIKDQFEICQQIASSLGCIVLASTVYEADDLLASYRCQFDEPTLWLCKDKDLLQSMQQGDVRWDLSDKKGERQSFDVLCEQQGFHLSRMPFYQALVGDNVDCITGIKGIGHKTAQAIVKRWPNLSHLLNELDQVAELKVRGAKTLAEKISINKEQIEHNLSLTTLATDAPIINRTIDEQFKLLETSSIVVNKQTNIIDWAIDQQLPKTLINKMKQQFI